MNPLRLSALVLALAAGMGSGASSLYAAPANVPASATRADKASRYLRRDDVRQFISEMVERHRFVRGELEALFRKVVVQPEIIKAMTPPAEPPVRSWQNYRALFVNPQRIEAGLRFRERNADALKRATAQFGVPAEIVLAILGVETVYGRNMGRYRVADVLATLAFDLPHRAEYFRSELENFLLYTRDAGVDVFSVKGSYAGAIGIPQFMPGSYRRFGVDFDGDGQTKLAESAADAIGSVANFLKEHGWEAGRPVAFPARVEGNAWRKFITAGVKPAWRIADLSANGVVIDTAGQVPAIAPEPDTLGTLVELETPGQPTVYWVGLQNFYALTRYNRSSFYAMAVLELATAIRQASPVIPDRAVAP